jgi:hypothetical protein
MSFFMCLLYEFDIQIQVEISNVLLDDGRSISSSAVRLGNSGVQLIGTPPLGLFKSQNTSEDASEVRRMANPDGLKIVELDIFALMRKETERERESDRIHICTREASPPYSVAYCYPWSLAVSHVDIEICCMHLPVDSSKK